LARVNGMKWYNSVKVKLLGFFLFISIFFLLSMYITFFVIRENALEKNASAAATLATTNILQHIKNTRTKAEEIVLTLASIAEKELQEKRVVSSVTSAVLNTDKHNSINIASGGLWFEPYATDKDIRDYVLFYNRNKKDQFKRIKNYTHDFRSMEFYTLAKKIKPGEVLWTSAYDDPETHVHMITVVSPIFKNNHFAGVASIDIKIGGHNKKFWDEVASENMYLLMLDKNGNVIGQSSSLKSIIGKHNIYKIENSKIKKMLKKIKPVLTHSIRHHHNNEHDLLNKIYFIDNDPIFKEKSILSVYHFPGTHWNVIIGIPEDQVMYQENKTFQSVLLIITILTLLATALGYLVLQTLFAKPINSITVQLQNNLSEDGGKHKLLTCEDDGEIGVLVDNINNRTLALEKAQKSEAEEIQKRLKNEKMLIQQSKMAAMGEMMDAVAHQWKQPLNALSMYSEIIKSDFAEGTVDQDYINKFRDDLQVQIDHMINTLDEFRTFFRPNKENEMFSLLSIVHSVLFLTKDDLLKNRMTVNIEQKDHIDIDGSANEFKHLLLNIINNAKDAFNDKNVDKRVIKIRLIRDENGKRMEIEDNAGGIPEEIIQDIFKANITSKEEGKGTGIGLYMSTQIASKHHATLSVANKNDGACFTIAFKD